MGQRSSKPKSRLLSKPRRIADETFAQPVVEHASRIQVTSLMTVSELVACLVKKGCSNITDQLDLAECSEYPISGGGFGDVYRGRLKNGDRVAIKTMRLSVSSNGVVQNSLKNAARELYTWSKCEHDNIQRLLGLVEFRGQVGMVSPWQPNGNLHQYLERYPETDRYEMSTQISDGLAYLHRTNIVHGDLKGLNILISKAGSPLLADFGNSFLRECTLKFTDTSSKHLVSLRWAAPELLGGTAKHNTRTDVYALGMTILETMTKNVPHPEKSELAIINAVLIRKAIPNRPLGDIPVGCMRGDMLWEILKLCWAYEPQDRPNAEEVKNAIIDITNAEHMLKNSEVVESVITSNSSSINTPVEQASGLNHVMDLCPSLESVTSVRRATRRRALIIAFDYKHTDNLGDSQSDIKSLNSASNDARDLAATFVDRGYSVETIIEEAYNREDVLDTIAGFLGSAVAGDVHVIIFSGHAARTDGTSSSPAMVLPVTSANKLHADDWNRNIRAHAKPGVIVLSVIATCYSGGFVERGTRIIDIERIPKAEGVVNEPIYITFSASGPFEVAYESPIDSDDPEYHCHLLWAVAGTVRDQEIKSWDEFIMGLRERFSYARVKGLAARGGEGQNGVKWLCDHPQHPEFTTTAPGYLPAWDVIFPANAE